MIVGTRLDQHIEDLALGVDSAPQIDHAAGDFQVDFIQMPDRVGPWVAFAQIRGDDRPEMIHSAPDRFVRDRNPPFRQQIFDIAKAQREPKIEPNRLLNDNAMRPPRMTLSNVAGEIPTFWEGAKASE